MKYKPDPRTCALCVKPAVLRIKTPAMTIYLPVCVNHFKALKASSAPLATKAVQS